MEGCKDDGKQCPRTLRLHPRSRCRALEERFGLTFSVPKAAHEPALLRDTGFLARQKAASSPPGSNSLKVSPPQSLQVDETATAQLTGLANVTVIPSLRQ